MNRDLIPFVVAFLASAFVAWNLLKDSKDDKGWSVVASIVVFVVSLSITNTILFIPFGKILKMLAAGTFLAGLIAGVAYFMERIEGKYGNPKRDAMVAFAAGMCIWFIAIGIIGGGSGDYNDCHDAGPWGIYTECE